MLEGANHALETERGAGSNQASGDGEVECLVQSRLGTVPRAEGHSGVQASRRRNHVAPPRATAVWAASFAQVESLLAE